MKRIWWPFCLLTLSRRIMCLGELSSAGVRPSGHPQREKKRRRASNSPHLVCVPSPISSGRTASKWRARRDTKPRSPDSKSGYHVPSGIQGKGLRPSRKKSAPALRPGPEMVDQNHAGRLRGSSRAHNALARLTGESGRGEVAQAAIGRKPDSPHGRERIGHAFALKIGRPPKLESRSKKKEAPASMLGPLYHRINSSQITLPAHACASRRERNHTSCQPNCAASGGTPD